MCVCVWLILSTHIFLYGDSCEFLSSIIKQVKLIEGLLILGDLMLKAFASFFDSGKLFSLTL